MKKTLVAILLLAALLMTCSVASADSWKPKTSVTIYCVSAAGGATDYTDRAMAQALSDYWVMSLSRLSISRAGPVVLQPALSGTTHMTVCPFLASLKLYSASVPWAFLIRRLLLGT